MTAAYMLTLLSKPGCHLCEQLRADLDDLQPEWGFAIEELDITRNAELFARYRHDIPVLLRDGAEIARGPMTPAALVTLLRRLNG